jgi:polyhydroxyalkanoate synthesis regulator phasin
LQPEEAKEFVQEILNSARVENKKKVGYFPFTEDAIEAGVSTIVSITPRKVVDMMQQLIEECRLANMDPAKGPISAAMLDKKAIWEMVR